jgi:hypothetical protein
MAAPEAEDYVETFTRALDSVCKSLILTLDDDASNGTVPMEDLVRVEVEEELERLTRLKDEVGERAKGGPEAFAMFVRSRKSDIGKALDFYQRRLEDGMKAAKGKDGYTPAFGKTQKELQLVKLARRALASPP